MKNKTLLSLLLACLCALPACNNDKGWADRVLISIKNGDLHFTQTPNGKELIIIPNEIPNTFSMANHLIAENDGKGDFLDQMNALHNIPKGLESYEFVKETSDSTLICKVDDISKKVYETDTIIRYKETFKTYDEFLEAMELIHKKSNRYEFLENKTKIKYCNKVYQKRFIYKCKTIDGYKKLQICFLKESGKMNLCAIFSENI